MEAKYFEIEGTSFNTQTQVAVADILNEAIKNRTRLRIFYGDTETGRDWMEEYDVIGYIGRSTGNIKIPLMIDNKRSHGGPALLTHCIVKITQDKKVLWQHPKYNIAPLTWSGSGDEWFVHADKEHKATFKTEFRAANYIQYLLGNRNCK